MLGTNMLGDRAFGEDEYFEFVEKSDFGYLTTTKRGGKIPFKWGETRYRTCVEQRDIPVNGPAMTLGATRAIGELTSHLVAFRNGTG